MYDKQKIPVPLEYWAIAYDGVSKEALAFLGNNNPHSEDITKFKCKNICSNVKWLGKLVKKFEDETDGHITCCSVSELATHIPYIKELEMKKEEKSVRMI